MSFGQRKSLPIPQALGPLLWDQLVMLPIDVGLWMARLDLGGGAAAERAERAQLTIALTRLAHKFQAPSFVFQIILETSQIKNWPPPLPEKVLFARAAHLLTALQPLCPPTDIASLKLALIDIAESIARASPDHPTPPWWARWMMGDQTLWTGPIRVSKTERAGLNRLIAALGADHFIKPWKITNGHASPSVRAMTGQLSSRFFHAQ